MAGYIMSLGAIDDGTLASFQGCNKTKEILLKEKALEKCIENGIYATFIKSTSGSAFLGTRADYLGMRPGENIYFFFNRCIYGIGEIIGIDNNAAFGNKNGDLYSFSDDENYPFFCLFKAAPYFFKNGVDMDEVLLSNPEDFRMLRFFHKRSFIKLDDIENKALKTFIIQKNELALEKFDKNKHYDASNQEKTFTDIQNKFLLNKSEYVLNAANIFKEGVKVKKHPNRISSETYVEGLILDYVKKPNRLLGYWDFITRQYPASPAEPSEYVDYMDVFGYRYVKGYEKEGIISKYVVMELKSKEVNEDTILQVMKYVDWICKEFAHNDYSMIEAYIVGEEQREENLLSANEKLYTRNYIKGSKHNANRGIDVETGEWKNVKFINYVDILNDFK